MWVYSGNTGRAGRYICFHSRIRIGFMDKEISSKCALLTYVSVTLRDCGERLSGAARKEEMSNLRVEGQQNKELLI